MKAQICPVCGAGELKKKVSAQHFEYKGESITISNYVTYMCNECGESIIDNVSVKESGKKLKNFQREVDGLLTGQQIKAIRIKLGLTQEQLADIVGGGLKSLARYESGQVCQSKGMDNLLRILDAYPETLKVIQKGKGVIKSSAKVIYFENARREKTYSIHEKTVFWETEEAVYGA